MFSLRSEITVAQWKSAVIELGNQNAKFWTKNMSDVSLSALTLELPAACAKDNAKSHP